MNPGFGLGGYANLSITNTLGSTSIDEITNVINGLFKDNKEAAEGILNVFDVTNEFIKNFEGQESLSADDLKQFYELVNPLINEFQDNDEDD